MTLEVQRRGMVRPISDLPAPVSLVSPLVEVEDLGVFYQAPYGGGGGGGNAPDTYDAYTALQFPFSADFLDLKSNASAPTSSTGAAITGGKLVCAGGSGNGLQYASVATRFKEVLSFGTLPFTIEGWFQTASTVASGTIMEMSNASFNTGSWALLINGDGVANSGLVAFWDSDVSSGAAVLLSSGATKYNDNVRHHVRIVRCGNQYTLYIDGLWQSRTTNATASTDATQNLRFGFSVFASRAIAVTLDNWRVLKGLAASTDWQFTVPTPPFPTS